jgi:putative Ca2+/H+ antiporter (TMEM165/GDT1 family)
MTTYRHRAWVVVTAVFLAADLAGLVSVVAGTLTDWAFASTVKGVVSAFFLLVVAAVLVAGLRIRTEVDSEAVTQHWVTRSFRIPFAEITGVEVAHAMRRSFLRVRCGERTYEVLPCIWTRPSWLGDPVREPPGLLELEAVLGQRRKTHQRKPA